MLRKASGLIQGLRSNFYRCYLVSRPRARQFSAHSTSLVVSWSHSDGTKLMLLLLDDRIKIYFLNNTLNNGVF